MAGVVAGIGHLVKGRRGRRGGTAMPVPGRAARPGGYSSSGSEEALRPALIAADRFAECSSVIRKKSGTF
jgi:hypothetical protein